ncbi:tRNA (adenosine(37)-N6)-threonylcarbamoyltransferase complex ATPase subunit type 1 TsaE [Imperialibacter roseus]|uniref:tRNA threonylcarbamoyladenosine biosynthesis protein TsaE n=1 Tax=Imperialibacter roseus TaxID=1324217 RepID=A0ABZ0IVI9_9BACT|nr:tRNA (adenosine(37)-N6)-threonylcarbamoyltransferase complex ATPase subunit type 1 TsaE [Imperialibacter roseus]WOK07657.1 tRNA (adenosine(37)-N6)-threonylcarbamoyltransferase complex ATPase subunit type 1 TsaE [Imperialibacter roseus]
MTTELFCEDIAQLPEIASQIIGQAGEGKVWIFEGELGAGKTTLIKELCEQLEVVDNVSSPTFSIVNEYETTEGETIYHFDFYRIKSEAEAADIGVDEYFYSGNYCFIEWPSKIPSLLPEEYLKITLILVSENQRKILLERYG